MSSPDPKRLSSLEHVPELTDALQAARERLPDAGRLEALFARVEASAGASVAPAGKTWPITLKVVAPLLGIAGALIGAQRLARQATVPGPYVAPSASSVFAPRVAEPPPSAQPVPNSTLPLPPPARIARSVAPLGSSPPVMSVPPVVSAAPASSELDLLKQAGQALRGDPARALHLTMDHARLYPSGALAEEREVIAIEALANLGRLSAARSRAERFMVAYPRSAHLSRVHHAAALDAKIDEGDQNNAPPSALDQ